MIPTGYTPAEVLDLQDPGDDTLRNFRYQLHYGIILLIHAILKKNNYIAIYCEHHDDFLCELANGAFDAVQVKSRKKENGAWKITDDDILKTIHRFYKLTNQFPSSIEGFHIISNAEYKDTNGADELTIAQCPRKFCEAAKAMPPIVHSNKYIIKNYELIKKYFKKNGTSKIDDTVLCGVLTNIEWHTGPDRDSCYDHIVASQVTQLPKVKHWTTTKAHDLVKALLVKVLDASSKHIAIPDQWFTPGLANAAYTSAVQHKRVLITDIQQLINTFDNGGSSLSNYYRSQTPIDSAVLDKSFPKTTKKMKAGGIEAKHIEEVKAYADAANEEMHELLLRQLDMDDTIIKTIQGLVVSACNRAELAVTCDEEKEGLLYGRNMLSAVYKSMQQIEQTREVETQARKFEFLVGMVGLLTEDCRVWWSKKFDLNAA